jgi:predicted transcriptional regulator of viral defense system
MNLYFELLKKPVFTMEDVLVFYGNINSCRNAVKRLVEKGMVYKIRRNMYTCKSGETGEPVADRFQIASNITKTSYISHHSAMEYYGVTDQVFYEVYVSSETEFKNFDFDGYTYRFVKPKISSGIVSPQYSGGIHVTDKERTILDCIKDMDHISGYEEVISNVESMQGVKEQILLKYLELYNNQFLYQKTGFLLLPMQKQFGLSNSFFDICKEKAGKSTRYLSSDHKEGKYYPAWSLVVPDIIFHTKNGGMIDADV